MKRNILCILIFSVLLSNYFLMTNVVALDYSLPLSEDDSFIWTVDTFDEETYDIFFDDDPDFGKQGLSKKYEVSENSESSKYWDVKYKIWDYTLDTDRFQEEEDDEISKKIYKDPEDTAERFFKMEDILDMWVVPTPFLNYIEGFRDAFNISQINVYVSGSSLSAKYAFESIKYEIKLTYSAEGIAEFIEYIDDNGNAFVKIVLERELNFTLILVILFVSIIGIIGIFIVVWKKRSSSHS